MIQDTEKTNVEFYVATYQPTEESEVFEEVIAVFIDTKQNIGYSEFQCYAFLGQHSTCSQSFLRENCRKINKKEDYQDLKTELESIGYNLNIV